MAEVFEAKVEKDKLFIDEALSNLDKKVGSIGKGKGKERNAKKESKEKQEILELEKENYKIDFGLSEEEKKSLKVGETKNGVTKEEATAYFANPSPKKPFDNRIEKKVIVLKKKIEGAQKDAFVREYLDGFPSELKGEQLFNWNAIRNLAAKGKIDMKKLPTLAQMENNIKGEKTWTSFDEFLDNYFTKGGKDVFTGHWDSKNKRFSNVESQANCWLSGGAFVTECGRNFNFIRNNSIPTFGFSVRLLK